MQENLNKWRIDKCRYVSIMRFTYKKLFFTFINIIFLLSDKKGDQDEDTI